MSSMFYNCYSLISLNLSNFNTENLGEIDSMFEGCHSLTSINLSNFVDKKITNINNIFNDCPSLKYIDVSFIKWNNKGKVKISDFKANSGYLIIRNNLLSNLIIKPEYTWTIKNISDIDN